MRYSVNFWVFIFAVASTANAQNQNINQNTFGGATRFPNNYNPYFEENDLQAEQFFYFDMDLLKEISQNEPDGNILISPLSIKSVLAMILEGAMNETADELRMALHLPNNRRVREQFLKLLDQFKNPISGVDIRMANRIFVSTRLTLLPSFEEILRKYYNSNVSQVDFYNPTQSANTINSWANEKTNGLIPTLVDEGSFGGDISILLANVLYFKGQWEKAFSDMGTKNSCFYLSSGECQMTPMMDVVDNFKYEEVKRLDAKFLELPYSGGEYSMIIVLPNNKNGIQLLSRDIGKASINSIVQNMTEAEVFITLPRFKIEYNTDLVNYLSKLHVSNILGPNANLKGIVADVSMRVTNALHKTYIEINEQGTVAAAATGAVVIPLMGTSKPRFKADHPFLFFIRHISTGTILFEGRMSMPERARVQQNQQQQPNQHQNNQQNQQNQNNHQNQHQNNPQNQQPNYNQQPQQQPESTLLNAPQNTNNYQGQPLYRPQVQPQPQSRPQVQPQPQSHSQPQSQTQPDYSTRYTPPQSSFLNNQQFPSQTQSYQNSQTGLSKVPIVSMVGAFIKEKAQRPHSYTSNVQGQVIRPGDSNVNDLGNIDNSKSSYDSIFFESQPQQRQ